MEQSTKRRLQLAAVLCFAMAMLFAFPKRTAFAASQVSIARIDYSDENIIVNNNGNKKIYFASESEAATGTWEEIAVTDPSGKTEIDFSYLSPSKANILLFTGENEADKKEPVRVVINEKAKKLSVAINYERADDLPANSDIAELVNIQAAIGNGNDPIKFTDLEWKKGEGGTWYKCTGNADPGKDLTAEKLQRYMIKGATLYFRIGAIDVSSASGIDQYGRNNGRRYSDGIKVKITKRPAAPKAVNGIDGSKFAAKIKYGQEYRVTEKNGVALTNPAWVKIVDKKVKSIDLAEIAGSGDGYTSKFPSVVIEYRNYAGSNKAASKISTITMPEQRVPNGVIISGNVPNAVDPAREDVYVSYSGDKYLVITIPSASSSKPYEYAIMKTGDTNYGNAKWTEIAKSSSVKVSANLARENYELIVRLKEIKNKEIASTLLKLEGSTTDVTYTISYPSVPSIEPTLLEYIKGYSTDPYFVVKLNAPGKVPLETEIESVKLGTKVIDIKSVEKATDSTGSYMKVTLKHESLNSMAVCTNKPLTITFKNKTVNKTSVRITITAPKPAPSLNATAAPGSTAGTTAITLNPPASGNKYVVEVGAKVTGKTTSDKVSKMDEYKSGTDIHVTAGQYVTVYEVNIKSLEIVAYKSIEITASLIKN